MKTCQAASIIISPALAFFKQIARLGSQGSVTDSRKLFDWNQSHRSTDG